MSEHGVTCHSDMGSGHARQNSVGHDSPFPHFGPFGSLIQGAAPRSSFEIKSGLAAAGPIAGTKSHTDVTAVDHQVK